MQLLLRSLALLIAMGALPAPGQDELKTVTPERPSRVALTYLGSAGWIISDGRVTIVIDPYVSRLRFSVAPGSTLEQVPRDQRPIHSARPEHQSLEPLAFQFGDRGARGDVRL